MSNEIKSKLLYKSDKPTNLVILGGFTEDTGDLGNFKVTDDESGFGIIVGDGTKTSASLSCDGFGAVVTVEQYRKWSEGEYGDTDEDYSISDKYLLRNFQGEIGVTAKLEDGTYTDQFDLSEYIQHQDLDEDWVDVLVTLPEGTSIERIEHGSDLKQIIREESIDEVLNSNLFHFTYESNPDVGETVSVATDKDFKSGNETSPDLPQTVLDFFDELGFYELGTNVFEISKQFSNIEGKDMLIDELSAQTNFEYELHTKKNVTISDNNLQNDPITNEGEAYSSKVDDFLDSVTDKEEAEVKKEELSFEDLMKWYDDKKEEIKTNDNIMDVDRDFQLGTLESQRQQAIDSFYLKENQCDPELEVDEAINWYKDQIAQIIGDSEDEDELKKDDELTEEEQHKVKAWKTQLAYLVYAREQEAKHKKFQDTQFDFYEMSEKLNERLTKVLKDRVNDYYEDFKNIQYVEKDRLQKVIDESNSEWEEVFAAEMEDTDKVALGMEVKEGPVPGHATRESMVYVLVSMEWAFEGSVGDGLSHKKQWGFPTDFIREWKKMSWLFGDEKDKSFSEDDLDELDVNDSSLDDLLSDLKSK